MSALPPCVLDKPTKHMVRSVVAKVSSTAALATLGAAELVHGAGSFAVVEGAAGNYFVLTAGKHHDLAAWSQKLKQKIEQLPGDCGVQWVRPLNRRLQRLFEWGDVASDRAAVARACKAGDTAELLAIMPQAHRVIEAGDFNDFPALFDAVNTGMPALIDCNHKFFSENAFQKVAGPCGANNSHTGRFTKCTECGTMRCYTCAHQAGAVQEDGLALLRAYHDCRGEHEWEEDKKAVCTLCSASCLDLVKVMKCRCGMQMCGGCIEAPPQQAALRHIWSWRGNPTQPMPFHVVDHEKLPDDEKLAWMQQELGSGADLATFAAKFLELFGEKLKGAVPQKAACLKLFATYNAAESGRQHSCHGAGWKKEGDLPPTELEAFQQVWDPKAPARCRECNSSLPADTPFTAPYCSDKCREAGKRLSCWQMVSGARCTGKVEIRNGCRVCTTCKNGKDTEDMVKTGNQKREVETSLDRSLKRQADQLRMVSNLWKFGQQPDPDHEPAWGKRRRTAR